ncbi:MAG: hypothetical protein ACK4S4_15960 [Pyrinomonadaceae bacterium]
MKSETTNAWGIDNGELWPNTFDTRRDAIKWIESTLGMSWNEIKRDKRIPKILIVQVTVVRKAPPERKKLARRDAANWGRSVKTVELQSAYAVH